MLARKISDKLEAFYRDNGRHALLLTGARQVGKTFSVRQFAAAHYDVFIEINFIESPDAAKIFSGTDGADEILTRITAFTGNIIVPGRTLVFLDEIQRCPDAMTAVKFLVADGRCHYAISGSLLGVELKNIRSYPVGSVKEERMFPLDFEEFVGAVGESGVLLEKARQAFEMRQPLGEIYHGRLLKLFRLYLVVGGMPAAVQRYVDTHDIAQVVAEQKMILDAYRRDISQYDERDSLRIREVFNRIPSELNDANKRFRAGSVVSDGHFDRLEDEFVWLREAGVAIPSYCVEVPRAPLELARKRNMFKLFSNDVGLLSAMYMNGIQIRILNGEKSINFGSVYENAVAQELAAHGIEPNYFNSKKQGELDFVIERDGEAIPLEVKSGKDYKRHSALTNVMGNGEYGIREALVLGNCNVLRDGALTYLPVYMAAFINSVQLPAKMIYTV